MARAGKGGEHCYRFKKSDKDPTSRRQWKRSTLDFQEAETLPYRATYPSISDESQLQTSKQEHNIQIKVR